MRAVLMPLRVALTTPSAFILADYKSAHRDLVAQVTGYTFARRVLLCAGACQGSCSERGALLHCVPPMTMRKHEVKSGNGPNVRNPCIICPANPGVCAGMSEALRGVRRARCGPSSRLSTNLRWILDKLGVLLCACVVCMHFSRSRCVVCVVLVSSACQCTVLCSAGLQVRVCAAY